LGTNKYVHKIKNTYNREFFKYCALLKSLQFPRFKYPLNHFLNHFQDYLGTNKYMHKIKNTYKCKFFKYCAQSKFLQFTRFKYPFNLLLLYPGLLGHQLVGLQDQEHLQPQILFRLCSSKVPVISQMSAPS